MMEGNSWSCGYNGSCWAQNGPTLLGEPRWSCSNRSVEYEFGVGTIAGVAQILIRPTREHHCSHRTSQDIQIEPRGPVADVEGVQGLLYL